MISGDLTNLDNGESSSDAANVRDAQTHIAMRRDSPSNWDNAIDQSSCVGISNHSIDVETSNSNAHMLIRPEVNDQLATQRGGKPNSSRNRQVDEQRGLSEKIDDVSGENTAMMVALTNPPIDNDDTGGKSKLSPAEVEIGDGRENLDKVCCRICHLGSDHQQESDQFGSKIMMDLIQLGCRCRSDLSFAHPQCAGTWFQLKGNRMCEICGDPAENVPAIARHSRFMEQWNEVRFVGDENNASNGNASCWQGKPFCNFLMAFLVLAFVLPWFLRVNLF